MTNSTRTFWFNCGVWIMNAILFVLIEGGLYLALMLYVLPELVPEGAESNGVVNAVIPIALLAGMILCMFISVKIVTWAIVHFHLEEKLDPKLVNRYLKNNNLKK